MCHRPGDRIRDWNKDQVTAEEIRIHELEQEVRNLNRVLTGMRNYIKIASEYKNDDLEKRMDGIQAALAQAAKYEPRQIKGRRNGRERG